MKLEVSVQELIQRVGDRFGPSPWYRVTQEQIQRFAEATGDFQWIHVDVKRAASGPFGGPIAHGYLTLALCPLLLKEVFVVTGTTMDINYGLDRVRFPRPLRTGAQVQLSGEIVQARLVTEGVQAWLNLVLHDEDDPSKPVCAALSIVRYLK